MYSGTSIKPRANGRAKYVRYNEVFVILRFFSSYNFTLTGVKKIVRYTGDFVIKRFVISRFYLLYRDPGTVFSVSFTL